MNDNEILNNIKRNIKVNIMIILKKLMVNNTSTIEKILVLLVLLAVLETSEIHFLADN